LPNPRRWLTENGQILEDDLPRMARSRTVTYRDWPNPDLRQAGMGQARYISYHDLASLASQYAKSQKRIWWNQKPKAIFRGQAISACRKPELIGIFKLAFRELKKQLWLDRAIAEIPKPH
jgi:hypothetical protein